MEKAQRLLTLIIADYCQHDSLFDCLNNISSWFPDTILVSNNPHIKERLKEDSIPNLAFHNSQSIYRLWEEGLSKSKTKWNLLITSNEIVTGELKNSIENQIISKPTTEKLYKIKKKVIFLKKVLKYPLEWPCQLASCLIFSPHEEAHSLNLIAHKNSSYLQGELVHFSNSSIAESITEVLRLAKVETDRLIQLPSPPNLAILITKTIFKSTYIFFYNLVLKKGFKERYEGFIFSIMGSIVLPLVLIQYLEKYFRDGLKIKNKLSSIKNILIIKARGAGDLILATPILRNIKKLLPHAKIHVLVGNGSSALLDNNPYVESVTSIGLDCSVETIKKISGDFIQHDLDLAINLDSTTRTSRLLKKIPAKIKINRSYYFRDKNTDILVGFTNTFRSVIERELDILRAIGLEPVDKHTEVFLGHNEIEWAQNFLRSNSFSHNKKTVLVSPISSLEIRDWGIEKFALLCKNLAIEDNIQIIVNVAPKEIDRLKPLIKLVPEALIFSGSIRELLGLINESDLLIGSDSGPSQFSIALNIPTITLNGPSVSSFYRDPDLVKSPHYTFNKDVPCRDLFHSQCFSNINPATQLPSCNTMICLDFSVDEITQKALEIISL
jgi:heptosyltransferase-2